MADVYNQLSVAMIEATDLVLVFIYMLARVSWCGIFPILVVLLLQVRL